MWKPSWKPCCGPKMLGDACAYARARSEPRCMETPLCARGVGRSACGGFATAWVCGECVFGALGREGHISHPSPAMGKPPPVGCEPHVRVGRVSPPRCVHRTPGSAVRCVRGCRTRGARTPVCACDGVWVCGCWGCAYLHGAPRLPTWEREPLLVRVWIACQGSYLAALQAPAVRTCVRVACRGAHALVGSPDPHTQNGWCAPNPPRLVWCCRRGRLGAKGTHGNVGVGARSNP